MLRAQPPPATDVRETGNAVQVAADGAQDRQGRGGVEALHHAQIDAAHPGYEVARGQRGVGELIQRHGLRPCEEGILPPVAVEGLGEGGLVVLAVAVTERGQVLGVALAGQDGRADPHARRAGDVAATLGARDSHRFEGFVHVLHVRAGRGDAHLPLPLEAAQHADLVVGAEGPREQAVGVQARQPRAVVPVGRGPAAGALSRARVAAQHPDAAPLKQLAPGDLGDAGGRHHDGGDAAARQPVGDGFQVTGAGAARADRRGGAVGGHGDPGDVGRDVEAGGVGVDDAKRLRGWRGRRTCVV